MFVAERKKRQLQGEMFHKVWRQVDAIFRHVMNGLVALHFLRVASRSIRKHLREPERMIAGKDGQTPGTNQFQPAFHAAGDAHPVIGQPHRFGFGLKRAGRADARISFNQSGNVHLPGQMNRPLLAVQFPQMQSHQDHPKQTKLIIAMVPILCQQGKSHGMMISTIHASFGGPIVEMKCVGLIVEYNPLHYGHVHHFEQSKRAAGAEAAIAVMSGHFLQRGEPAMMNKWARAETALRMGVDVVIELPVVYATSPAEWFAYGAVSLLDATGVVDTLCFGSELGQTGPLAKLAALLAREPAELAARLRRELKTGVPYPAAYARAVAELASSPDGGEPYADLLLKPNNILGLHYMIALRRLNSRIEPLTIARIKAEYHQTDISDGRIASATAIRKTIFETGGLAEAKPFLPPFTFRILEREAAAGRAPIDWERLRLPLLEQALVATPQTLAELDEMDEGLEYRLLRTLAAMKRETFTVRGWLSRLKTKRYTQAKLQRTLIRLLLGHRRGMFEAGTLRRGPAYIRVLGFSARGRELLKRMKRTARLPIIVEVRRSDARLLAADIQATSVYALAYREPDMWHAFRDFYEPPLRIDG